MMRSSCCATFGCAIRPKRLSGKTDHLGEAIEAIARDLDEELQQVEGQGEAEDAP